MQGHFILGRFWRPFRPGAVTPGYKQ